MPPPLPSRPSLNGNNDHHGPPPVAQTVRHHQPYYRSYSSSSSASFKGCCCCLFLLFAFLALVVLAVVLIVLLAVKPKKPQFDLQQVAVMNMGISSPDNPNPSVMDPISASLSFTIRMLFTAGNPNKVGIRYGESSFTVLYKGIPLGRATVPGFYQDAHSTRNVEATIAVDRVNLMQGMAADIVRDASLNDRVELTVRGDVSEYSCEVLLRAHCGKTRGQDSNVEIGCIEENMESKDGRPKTHSRLEGVPQGT